MSRRTREMSDADWAWLVGHAQGRRIVADLLSSGGLVAPVVSDNALRAAYLEGRRAMACEIYSRVTDAMAKLGALALMAEVLSVRHVTDNHGTRTRDDDDDGSAG